MSNFLWDVLLRWWPTLLGCSFIVTNIPLGAYLLRVGAHF
jgi:hypothetical protein